MNILEKIEEKYNFSYPQIYHQLYSDNMLEYGEAGPNWYRETYPKLKNYPPLLLLSNEYEHLSFEDIQLKIESNRQINKKFNFIPFAISGAGDLYCFYLNEQDGDNVPIVYVWHDMDEVNYRAKNLQDFIFISLIDRVFDKEDFNSLPDNEFKESCQNTLNSHSKYLSIDQIKTIEYVFHKEFVNNEELTLKEYEDIVNKYASYSNNGRSFKYQSHT
ncbi:SMI1/KNR4 family protein [Cocleimonas sp. KMM 6892]|uniref:SMI1/KNR4 family protein n=1 Tax=unclassified Cocleimonas TaxID=2639732 RepID=UPI002DB808E6|nr:MULTISPECIES: SMI1/KNR4 family protein [unclassified Cocleimonas]MEB8434568.1 SMI1/KNR4 family protein [Cocleimonas sp. KMM 6892]MEC4717512.1 SMI1/KNR4 family protein [Cocleimonas sp. KMM 6895]MEC4746840.1 SMI1/KNR4 family protein [Cocleimonas sp. KMM 6896]